MNIRLALAALLAALILAPAQGRAQTIIQPSPDMSLYATQDSVSSQLSALPSVFLGSFTRSTLPTCDATRLGKYAFVTDLGGGVDTVICRTAGPWARIRLGAPQAITATSGTVTVDGLADSNFLTVTGVIPALTTLTVSINAGTMAPNSTLYVRRPSALLGIINIQLTSGGPLFSLLGSSTMVMFYDGSTLTQIQ